MMRQEETDWAHCSGWILAWDALTRLPSAGKLNDVYIPKDFHTGEIRGIAFIEASARQHCRGLGRAILGVMRSC